MCLLLESICVENGETQLLSYHEQRMNRSRKALWGVSDHINLEQILSPMLHQYQDGLYKCRVLYHQEIQKVEFAPYQRPEIKTLRKVYSQDIDYAYKYADREALSALFQQRDGCDDILIIKSGVVTDSYFANIIFCKEDQWFTSVQPLLKGVQRQFLLDHEIVNERQILESDLSQFTHFKFVNAMNPFTSSPAIEIKQIY